jgi:hypothetical protein
MATKADERALGGGRMTVLCDNCSPSKQCTAEKNRTECKYYQPQTNEEWLRSATTEYLAEWIAHQTMIALLENQNNHSLRMTYPAYWVEWLKQPHTTE